MSSETSKTLAFVVVALVLTGAAFLNRTDTTGGHETFIDQGQKFFPDFSDPFACTDLEVVEYDPGTATARQFKVMFKDGKWSIPSHHNYPADAKDRLAKTAGGVMDLTKDAIKSDRPDDQEALGVLDPLDVKAPLKGRGKRVTLRDKTEKVLADFIIGNEVKDRPGMRYVRVPNQKRIYGVNVKADLSTKFADWIETNLLKLDASRIRSITFNSHRVDPDAQKIVKGEEYTLSRKDSVQPWRIDKDIPEGQELDATKLSSLTTALGDLKIVGVRTKPEGLSRELKVASGNEVKPTTQSALQSLVSKGFYPTRDGLYSNQGDVVIRTDEGAVYTLRFGEATFATGEQLTAGGDEPKNAEESAKKAQGATENRYLMVTVGFDPTLIPEPEKPKTDLVIPADPFQKAPDDPKRIAEEKAAKEKEDAEKAAREKVVADAEKRVKTLSDRFADWYYVTPGDSFRSIQLDRPSIVKAKSDKPAGPAGGPDLNGFPGGLPGGLPGGFQLPGGHP